MTGVVAFAIGLFLAAGAAFHFYWAFGGRMGWRVAVPQKRDGTPLFVPRAAATFTVGIVMTAMIAFLSAVVLKIEVPVSHGLMRAGTCLLGIVFLARGLSWHPYAGLFKSVKDTDFGRKDTLFYSPGCVAVGLGFLFLAWVD